MNIEKILVPDAVVRYLSDIEIEKNAPAWFYQVIAPLTFAPYIASDPKRIVIHIGNSGLLFYTRTDEDTIEMFFSPNGNLTCERDTEFDELLNVGIWTTAFYTFLQLCRTLSDPRIADCKALIGKTNSKMYRVRDKLLKSLTDYNVMSTPNFQETDLSEICYRILLSQQLKESVVDPSKIHTSFFRVMNRTSKLQKNHQMINPRLSKVTEPDQNTGFPVYTI